ncbi:MAG TPA: Rne/Rng family ribonuclease, partial [Tepidisphaeraceae bacterium]|nr:Rne/Rng family ribonuclease [Tepidisphaeraceae bacterium]
MAKEMLINVSEGEECRIALVDNGKLEELYMERTSSTSHVGNIYKGRVTNVEPSIQAAFVDFGLGRNGFLHISDLMPTYFGRAGSDIQESVGKKMARRDRPPIQRCLRRGDEIIVQIIKEGIGTKGPTLSTYLSIPGRILVMMPGMGKMGVSKKIEDEEERRRLRQILDSLKPPKGVGFIIRTAGIGKSKAEIQRDLTYLSRLWMQIEKKRDSGPGPMELYTEGDLVARTVRDVFSADVERIVVDNATVAKRVKEVIKITSPRTRNKVDLHEEPIPLFHKYDIERDIEQMYSRHVPLPSGGSLVIDSTEAIVAIDVNSGKFRDHSDAEMTAFKTDLEAAEEIPRQLKLRDLGGVIICDFIDLRYERHRRELEEKLHENFKKDRAKTKVLRMSQFGIIEITRQRMRPSLKRSIYFDCPHCKGAGLVKTPESMSLDVMRRLAIAAHHEKVERIELSVCPDVSFYLLNKKRASLAAIEADSRKKIIVRQDPALGLDEMKLDLFDSRDGLVVIDELGLAQPPHTSQLNTRQPGQKGRGGHDRGGAGGGRGGDRRGGRDHGRGGGGGGRHQQP